MPPKSKELVFWTNVVKNACQHVGSYVFTCWRRLGVLRPWSGAFSGRFVVRFACLEWKRRAGPNWASNGTWGGANGSGYLVTRNWFHPKSQKTRVFSQMKFHSFTQHCFTEHVKNPAALSPSSFSPSSSFHFIIIVSWSSSCFIIIVVIVSDSHPCSSSSFFITRFSLCFIFTLFLFSKLCNPTQWLHLLLPLLLTLPNLHLLLPLLLGFVLKMQLEIRVI
jgi:hypothetical protein